MAKYICKTIYDKPVDFEHPIKFMYDGKLQPGMDAHRVGTHIHCLGEQKALLNLYHVSSKNVIIKHATFQDVTSEIVSESRRETIILLGFEKSLGEVEKIILRNIKRLK